MSVTQADSELPGHCSTKKSNPPPAAGFFIWGIADWAIAMRVTLHQHPRRSDFGGVTT
jgi:hypothetical protein